MNGMWAGYIWGEFASLTVRWEPPTNILVDASLHQYEAPRSGRSLAVAWVRSVAVRNPSTGGVTEKPSSTTVPMRFEDNAVGVTFGLNTTAGVEAEGLLHAFSWP
jgi:hypothetical protein